MTKYVPDLVDVVGMIEDKAANTKKQLSLTVVATSAKSLNLIFKSPKV